MALPDGTNMIMVLLEGNRTTLKPYNEPGTEYITTSGRIIVRKQHALFGLFKENGEAIFEPQFDSIKYIGDDLFVCEEYGEGDFLINSSGKILFHEILCEIIPELNRSRIEYRLDDKSGMIDTTGEVLIPHKYWRFEFAGNLIACSEGGKLHLVTNNDRILDGRLFDEIKHLSDKTFIAHTTDTGTGVLYDENGNVMQHDIFTSDGQMRHGLIPVKDANDKFGYMNAAGEITIPCMYSLTTTFFDNGTAVFGNLQTNGEYQLGLLDTQGVTLLQAAYDEIQFSKNVYTVVRDGKFQLLNKQLQPLTGLSSDPLEYLGYEVYAVYKMKTKLEYKRRSIWLGSPGGLSLYKEGVVTGVYHFGHQLLIEGDEYDPTEDIPVCSEGFIAFKQKGLWGFLQF